MMDEHSKDSVDRSSGPNGPQGGRRDISALLIGMEWFAASGDGGLNRYFYEMVQMAPTVGIGGIALVSALHPGQTAPLELRPIAPARATLWTRWRGARREIRRAICDGVGVVNSHFALYASPGLNEIPPSVPHVVHFHGPWSAEMRAEASGPMAVLRSKLAGRFERRVLGRAARVITLSRAFARIAQECYGVPEERVRVIPGGVKIARYLAEDRMTARERLGWPMNRPVLVVVRRLARRMGLEGLIEAMREVRRSHPDVLLMVGGKGELAPELEERIRRADLSDHVRLLGFVAEVDLPTVYAAADFSIVPTISLEGFGLITVESLAAGTPVLGTPVGGTPEILTGLDPALVFESTEPASLADRIAAVLSSQIPVPGADCCRAYAMRYDWQHVMPQVRSVFDEVIES